MKTFSKPKSLDSTVINYIKFNYEYNTINIKLCDLTILGDLE